MLKIAERPQTRLNAYCYALFLSFITSILHVLVILDSVYSFLYWVVILRCLDNAISHSLLYRYSARTLHHRESESQTCPLLLLLADLAAHGDP